VKAFIIMRDRASYAQLCLTALARAGLEPVVVDQGSTWPGALEWLDVIEQGGDALVLRKGNGHPRDLWGYEPFRELCGDDYYMVTDPDVVPSDDCPLDWPARLRDLLDRYPGYRKAGLGLRIDLIPETYQWRDKVISWEQQFWQCPIEPGVFARGIDTTLALYRPLAEGGFVIDGALRTGYPYVADHLSWYEDLDHLTPEIDWYATHAEPGISHWTRKDRSNWGHA
jgi:hypothetical protein